MWPGGPEGDIFVINWSPISRMLSSAHHWVQNVKALNQSHRKTATQVWTQMNVPLLFRACFLSIWNSFLSWKVLSLVSLLLALESFICQYIHLLKMINFFSSSICPRNVCFFMGCRICIHPRYSALLCPIILLADPSHCQWPAFQL